MNKIKYIFIVLLSVGLVFSVILYIKQDKNIWAYGLNSHFGKCDMPFGVYPRAHWPAIYPNVTLIDADDFEMLGAGFRMLESDFTIEDVLSYGYNDTSIIVKCTDSVQQVHYLVSYVTKYKYKNGNNEIEFRELDSLELKKNEKNYKWYNVGAADIEHAANVRTFCFLGIIAVFVVWLTVIIICIVIKKIKQGK